MVDNNIYITKPVYQPYIINSVFSPFYVHVWAIIETNETSLVADKHEGELYIDNSQYVVSNSKIKNTHDAIRILGSFDFRAFVSQIDNYNVISSSSRHGISIENQGKSAFSHNTVNNFALISGEMAAISISLLGAGQGTQIALITNRGILMGEVGVEVLGGKVNITNTGTIAATNIGIDGTSSATALTVVNNGILSGPAAAMIGGTAGDLYDGRLGRVLGVVGGADGDDTLLGGARSETLLGGDGGDEIRAAGGKDVLEGGAGADTLDGGTGFDLAAHMNAEAAVRIDLADGAHNFGEAAGDILIDIEGLIGSDHADTLLGDAGANELRGEDGDDMLDGRAGTDTLRGGLGDDLIFVDHASDRVVESAGEGADTVIAAVSYRLSGSAEVEWLTTADTPGTAAIDLTGSNTANAIMGNFGANRLSGLGGPDTLIGLGGQDTLSGGDGADLLLGGEGNDVLSGGAGNDSLEGGDGHDRLNGGAGLDRLGGGDGRDQFIFDTPGGTPDVIVDFTPADDTIRLSRSAFGGFEATGPLAAAAFALAADGVAGTASHRLLYDAATGLLWHDADGNGLGLATQIALLENRPANVTASDFLIIA